MKIMPVMSANAAPSKHKPQSEVNFEGKLKLPSQLPTAKGWFKGAIAFVVFTTMGFLTGCSVKSKDITGPDTTQKTELYTHAPTRVQVPTFNNCAVGQRLIDWYGNHMGITIPNRPITGFKYYDPSDQAWHISKAILASDEAGFKMVEKITNQYATYYKLHVCSLNGENEIIDSTTSAYITAQEAYNPNYNGWGELAPHKERLVGDNIRKLSMNDVLTSYLEPYSSNQLSLHFPEGGSCIYDQFAFTVKDGGAVPRVNNIPCLP